MRPGNRSRNCLKRANGSDARGSAGRAGAFAVPNPARPRATARSSARGGSRAPGASGRGGRGPGAGGGRQSVRARVRAALVRLVPHHRPGVRGESASQLVRSQEELAWSENRALGVMAPLLVTLGGVLPECARLFTHSGQLDDEGGLGQVVEHGAGPVEEQGQPVLDAGRGEPFAHVPVDRAGVRVALETDPPCRPEAPDRLRVERKLPGGKHPDRLDPVERPLRLGVEPADRIDLRVEEIDAIRPLGPGREQVQQRAPHRELTSLHHLAHAAVASEIEPLPLCLKVQPVAYGQPQAVAFHEFPRSDSAHEGGGGGDERSAACLGQRVQGGQALGDDVLVGGEGVVGEGLPVRKEKWAGRFPGHPGDRRSRCAGGGAGGLPRLAASREERDLGAKGVRRRGVGGDDEGQSGERPGRRGDGERSARTPEPFPMDAVAGAARKQGPQRAQWLHGSTARGRTDRPGRSLTRKFPDRRTSSAWAKYAEALRRISFAAFYLFCGAE